MSLKKKAIIALIIANTIWGAASPIFKWSLENISPFTLAFLRFSLASILIFPFTWHNLHIEKKDILSIIGIGFFGVGINIPFFFYGLKLAPSINAPMIASSGPIFLIICSIIFLKEKPKSKVVLGTLVSLLGVIVIILRPFLEEGINGTAILGNIFFLIATFGGVIHAVISKSILNKYSAGSITFWSFIVGTIIFLPFFISESSAPGFLMKLDTRGIIGILFGVIFSSTLAYFLYEWGIQKVAANEVGVFTYIDPIIALVIAIPLLGEKITPVFLLGSLFVFSGIFIAEGRIHYHPIPHLLKYHDKPNRISDKL